MKRLVLFSGLGIDPRLLEPQRDIPGTRVELAAWPEIVRWESLPAYARRVAGTIDPTGELYVGGMSFGAMVALEAAQYLNPRGVFVIAGARSGRAVSWLVKWTIEVASRLPEAMVRAAMVSAPLLVRMVGRSNRKQREFLLELAETSVVGLTQHGGRAMLNWTAPPLPPYCPIHHIHGHDDRMIPVKNLHPPPDVVVPGGGHVINVTHAGMVNQFIADRMRG